MVYGVGVLDLDAITTQIDDESKTVLDPEVGHGVAQPVGVTLGVVRPSRWLRCEAR